MDTGGSKPKLVHNQQLDCNAKDARILEGGLVTFIYLSLFLLDGPCDIVVAYSDRIVRLYKWVPGKPDGSVGELVFLIKWELAGQVNPCLFLSVCLG